MTFLGRIADVLTKGILAVRPEPFDTGWLTVNGTTTTIYITGDVVGQPISLTGVPKRGRIETVLVIDEDKEEIASNLAVFDEAPTLVADHDIFVVAVGEYNRQVGDIAVTNADYSTYSASSFATVNNVGLRYSTDKGSLVVYWVTRGAPTIAADKTLRVRFLGYSDGGEK